MSFAISTSSSIFKPFLTLQIFRSLGFLLILYLIYNITPLGLPYFFSAVSGLFGIYLAGKSLKKNPSLLKSLLKHAVLFGLILLLYKALEFILSGNISKASENDFLVYQIFQDIFTVFAIYCFCFFSTRLYWRSRHALTAETIILSSTFVWLLSGHRNYQLDSPKAISNFAWSQPWFRALNLGPEHALILLGITGIIISSLYLYLSSLRPLNGETENTFHKSPINFAQQLGLFICSALFLGIFSWFVNKNYSEELARSSNGVGLSSEEGDSPLGFHSAVGKTKQPAALVRLDSDYPENPIAPLLYFREGALSEFNGREMVQATKEYDNDIPIVPPGKAFISQKEDKDGRKSLKQSVYLLIEQKNSFALDYPKTIRIIKNPDQDRFKVSYQADSLVPTESFENFISSNSGSKTWTTKNWEHYLKAPASDVFSKNSIYSSKELSDPNSTPGLSSSGDDLRYASLAAKLTSESDPPLLKAAKIVEYMSKASLYTRQPGHEISKDEDPVAAYLFSDEMRGYCVHFAHAAVYMMRLAGVPARIGIGYMVDSKYAKDGHLLLHLGDRHAWSEIYLEDLGWVIIDVTPENAENEEPIVPDPSLLEELMGKIDPSEELLDPLEFDEGKDKKKSYEVLDSIKPHHFKTLLIFFLLSYLGLKAFLYNSYRLANKPAKLAERAWVSISSKLSDLGINRLYGETNLEFSKRLKREKEIDLEKLQSLKELSSYSLKSEDLSKTNVLEALSKANSSLSSKISIFKRILAFFNPASLSKIGRL